MGTRSHRERKKAEMSVRPLNVGPALVPYNLKWIPSPAFFSCYISAAGPSDRSLLRKGEKGGREEKRRRKRVLNEEEKDWKKE